MTVNVNSNQTPCEVVHFLTYWLGGKIIKDPDNLWREICDDTTHFKFVPITETPVHWFVHTDFLEESIVGQWFLRNDDELKDYTTECKLQEILNSETKVSLSKYTHAGKRYEAISCKLFWTGALSIVIKWEVNCSCKKGEYTVRELDSVVNLIKRPEETLRFLQREREQAPSLEEKKNVEN